MSNKTGELTRTIFWKGNAEEFLGKYYNLQFIPRIGEEVQLKNKTWLVNRIIYTPEIDDITIILSDK